MLMVEIKIKILLYMHIDTIYLGYVFYNINWGLKMHFKAPINITLHLNVIYERLGISTAGSKSL